MPRHGSIDWDEAATLNTLWGCTPVESDEKGGCRSCFIFRNKYRIQKLQWSGTPMTTVTLRPMDRVLREVKSFSRDKNLKHIFLTDMGDLFHEAVSFETLETWHTEIIEAFPQFIFRICTKRVPRMAAFYRHRTKGVPSNAMIGCSICSHKFLHQRLSLLKAIPARMRWISAEPLLEDLGADFSLKGIDFLVVGGESGKGNRPMLPEWVVNLHNICVRDGVAWWFKQRGGPEEYQGAGGDTCYCCGKVHHEFPHITPTGDPTLEGWSQT